MISRIIMIILIFYNASCFSVQPVIDNSNLAEMAKHLTEMRKHYEMLEDQYEQMKNEYEAFTGANNYSDVFELMDKNGNNFWAWSPDTESINQMTQNNQGNPNDALYKQIQHYNEVYGLSAEAEHFVPHDPENHNAALQAQQALLARQGLSISDVIFDRTHLYDKEQLNKLEDQGYALKDPKESIDYGNALQLELIKLFNDMLKLQTKQLQLMSINEVETSVHNDFNAKFFNTDH